MLTKEMITRVGKFDEKINASEDKLFIVNVLANGASIYKMSRSLAKYRYVKGTVTSDCQYMFDSQVSLITYQFSEMVPGFNQSKTFGTSLMETKLKAVGRFLANQQETQGITLLREIYDEYPHEEIGVLAPKYILSNALNYGCNWKQLRAKIELIRANNLDFDKRAFSLTRFRFFRNSTECAAQNGEVIESLVSGIKCILSAFPLVIDALTARIK